MAGTAPGTSPATVAVTTAGTAPAERPALRPARGDTRGRGNAVPRDAGALESAKDDGEDSAQAVLAGAASGVTTAMSQVSASQIPQPTKTLTAAGAVKKGTNTYIHSSYFL